MNSNQNKIYTLFIKYGLWACVAALWLAIGLYTYLGIFSRYMADDYCETMRVTSASSPLNAVIERYTGDSWPRASMRYSNLFFIGVSELLGDKAMQITIPAVILFWAFGLTLSMRELSKLSGLLLSIQAQLFAGGLLTFFSILLAPNLFQTFYWRSAVMTHFAPLVFGSFLTALLLKQSRTMLKHSLWVYASIFFTTFVIAGFSEPPAAVMATVFGHLCAGIYLWGKSPNNSQRLALVSSALLGTVIGIITMLSSPAITPVEREESVSFAVILLNSFIYSFQFLLDLVKSSPLPLGVALVLALLSVWLYQPSAENMNKKGLGIKLILVPLLLWVLVAASFAPSVYGQGFPVERARFLGSTLLVAAAIAGGVLLGLLLSTWRPWNRYPFVQWAVLALFVLTGTMYPFRRAMVLYTESISEYSLRAKYWDGREALILEMATAGETDLVIPGFSGIYGVKELDDRPNFWFNRCAAQIYGVNSIRTISYDPASLEELLDD